MRDVLEKIFENREDNILEGRDENSWPAPYMRNKEKQLRSAAVLIPILEHSSGFTILLTQRTETMSNHPGQIAFPGGTKEVAESTPEETALRETEEEIGVSKETIEIIGNLHPTTTRMGYLMHTYVGYSNENNIQFTMLEDEVERLIEIPVSHLFDPINQALITWQGQSRLLSQLGFRVEDELIFGATARVINEFINLVGMK